MQPFCRYCGRPIPKKTKTEYFDALERPLRPLDLEAARTALGNPLIVSHSWRRGRAFIDSVHTWDGESYVDPHFCKSKCATNLGRLLAREGHCTTDYTSAQPPRTESGENQQYITSRTEPGAIPALPSP